MEDKARNGERRGVWALLEIPAVYRAIQWTLGAHRWRRALVIDHAKPADGEIVLDLGCGVGDLLQFVEAGTYVGLDRNADYIAAAKVRYPNRGRFIADDVANLPAHGFDQVDCVMAAGLLHHIGDQQVLDLVDHVSKILKPGGRFVTLDPCFRERQHPVARLLSQRDRGEHVRSDREYGRLVNGGHFRSMDVVVRNDLLRLPCDYVILTCRR